MDSINSFILKILIPVSDETMDRIDYLLFVVLNTAFGILLKVWLNLPAHPSERALLEAMQIGIIPSLMLSWTWLCASLNRAADAGVTRGGFAKVFLLGPLVAAILFAVLPSGPTILVVLAALFLPTVFLFVWPSKFAR